MKIMCGFLKVDGGIVKIDGIDVVKKINKIKFFIGYMFDFFGVYDNFKVNEYLEFFVLVYGICGIKV